MKTIIIIFSILISVPVNGIYNHFGNDVKISNTKYEHIIPEPNKFSMNAEVIGQSKKIKIGDTIFIR
jgi:hypothetical protein